MIVTQLCHYPTYRRRFTQNHALFHLPLNVLYDGTTNEISSCPYYDFKNFLKMRVQSSCNRVNKVYFVYCNKCGVFLDRSLCLAPKDSLIEKNILLENNLFKLYSDVFIFTKLLWSISDVQVTRYTTSAFLLITNKYYCVFSNIIFLNINQFSDLSEWTCQ